MRSLEDFSAMTGGELQKPADGLALLDDEPQTQKASVGGASQSRPQSSIENSARAYRDINRTLGDFYETPREDPEKELLREELEELRMRMDESDNRKRAADEQMELMERSLQMASKYMPAASGTAAAPGASNAEPASVSGDGDGDGNVSDKPEVVPAGLAGTQTVSTLHRNLSDADFMEAFGKPRNTGFITAYAQSTAVVKNTIIACVHGNQTVSDGKGVRLRLMEHVWAGSTLIPRNTLVSGTAKIQGERLYIIVNSVEFAGQISTVELTVYDLDGQRGVFIPNLQELSAAKEIAANTGTSAGTSFNLNSDAGEQFVADMGRNLIQGVSQFTAKKLREVKVYLKSGYRIYLVSEELLKQKQKRKSGQALANK